MKKVVAITGGIGVGKSTVAKQLVALGIPLYNSDVEAKRLMQYNVSLKSCIIKLLGDQSYLENGELNKVFIGKEIFNDLKKRQLLNELVHPVVKQDFEIWKQQQQQNSTAPYLLYESALIFENNIQNQFYAVILVTAPQAKRIARVQLRDQRTIAQIKAIIDIQEPQAKLLNMATYVVNNDNLSNTLLKTNEIHKSIIDKINLN